MKKILSLVVAFCLCFGFGFVLAGCDEEENKYWLDTNTAFSAFIDGDYAQFENGIDFGEKIDTVIENGYATYDELETIYSPVFDNSIGFIKQYKDCFSIKPINNTKEVEDLFSKFNNEITTISEKLTNFSSTALTKFEEGIEGSDQENAESIISLQFLKEFKRDYIDLSTDVLRFAEKLLNLYIKAYQDIPTLKTEEGFVELNNVQIENYTRLALSKTIIYSLLPAIDYINSFNGIYYQYSYDNYIDILNSYSNIVKSRPTSTATVEKLYAFTYTYEAYSNDVEIFSSALSSIDMPTLAKDYEFDCYEYSQGNHLHFANATKVLMFSADSMYILRDKLVNLYS